MRKFLQVATLLMLAAYPASAKVPSCDGTGNWPASSAFGAMQNAKLVNNAEIDFSRTQVKRILSEKIHRNLWRQAHLIQFYRKDGSLLQVIAVSDASSEECSMGDVQTFVVSKELSASGAVVH